MQNKCPACEEYAERTIKPPDYDGRVTTSGSILCAVCDGPIVFKMRAKSFNFFGDGAAPSEFGMDWWFDCEFDPQPISNIVMAAYRLGKLQGALDARWTEKRRNG